MASSRCTWRLLRDGDEQSQPWRPLCSHAMNAYSPAEPSAIKGLVIQWIPKIKAGRPIHMPCSRASPDETSKARHRRLSITEDSRRD